MSSRETIGPIFQTIMAVAQSEFNLFFEKALSKKDPPKRVLLKIFFFVIQTLSTVGEITPSADPETRHQPLVGISECIADKCMAPLRQNRRYKVTF